MKTSDTVAVHTSPEQCQVDQEQSIDGNTLSGFIARGLTLLDAAHASGHYVSAATVLANLKQGLKSIHEKTVVK